MKRQEIIKFGGFSWIVLDVQDRRALLLSYFVLEEKFYHRLSSVHRMMWYKGVEYNPNIGVTWETCLMRRYLNREFHDTHFSDEEKQRILTVAIKNSDNPWYSTTGGNNTRDKLFLLSIDEVLEYFGDSGKLANETLADVNSGEICDQYDSARVAYNTHGFPATWALRTPGASNDEVAFIADDDYLSGSLCVTGREIRESFGIRPAMWVWI